MKPRHLFGTLLVLAEAPILAVLIAGWAVTGFVHATTLAVGHARPSLRQALQRARQGLASGRRRPPRRRARVA